MSLRAVYQTTRHTLTQWRRREEPQFAIPAHYDVTAELDRDIHENAELSTQEVELALRLSGTIPQSVFLPCFGTGRHIAALLRNGVQRIVGVDLSSTCAEKAKRSFAHDKRVELYRGDLCTWQTNEKFDAVFLLGNSFGDLIQEDALTEFVKGITMPLMETGTFIMDYIGTNYLDRCTGTSATWDVTFRDQPAHDTRTARYNVNCQVMTIHIEVRGTPVPTWGSIPVPMPLIQRLLLWSGYYQKRILNKKEIHSLFRCSSVSMVPMGVASTLNPYFQGRDLNLFGMIPRSMWWVGNRI